MKSNKCKRCKRNLLEEQLFSDVRLGDVRFCITCLVEAVIEGVQICIMCKSKFLAPNLQYHVCSECVMSTEWNVYNVQHMYRAKWKGLPHDLTDDEWKETLRHFKGLCAYCQAVPGHIFEHFVPIEKGGGTTKSNCVPACKSCDIKKGGHHPDEVVHKFPEGAIERVRSYLNQF